MIGLNPFRCDARWDQIALAVQIRHPKAVDDVVRSAANHDGAADGNVNFVGGDENAAGIGIVILHVPPPLISGKLDDHSVFRFAEIRDGFAGENAKTSRTKRIKTVAIVAAVTTRVSFFSVRSEGRWVVSSGSCSMPR